MITTRRIDRSVLVLLVIVLGLSSTAFAQKKKKLAPTGTPVLWQNPGNVSSRDLRFGPGAAHLAPTAPFTFVKEDTEQTNYFLTLVNDRANLPVYVHCKGGRHRTGAMTAVYRITHDGWTADQAWQEMKDYDFENGWLGGPGAQKKFVFAFYDQHRSALGQK